MRPRLFAALPLAVALTLSTAPAAAQPLRLHAANTHYLERRGKPVVLLGSGEHYGAVVNLDFDFEPYLAEIARQGLNLTRVFSGSYIEHPQAFGISNNTLAPKPGRFLAPWARSSEPGFTGGGNKLDLTKWDEAYFARLRRFVAAAARRGIVVELVFFCPFYEDAQWALSPLNATNNVNGIGRVARDQVFTGADPALQKVQEELVRKLVAVLADADNVYFEICNEPFTAGTGVTDGWQRRIADVFAAATTPARRPLLAQNFANGGARITNLHPAVSILNFHYAAPPSVVAESWALARPIGDDETGFRGTADAPYRSEAWSFFLAGGAIFSHLDYSFTTAHESGDAVVTPKQPGGGGRPLRQQLGRLLRFMNQLPFARMRPLPPADIGGVPAGLDARALARDGDTYAVYVAPALARLDYSVRWTGSVVFPSAGPWTLHTITNDGVRLEVAGKRVIEDWTNHRATEHAAPLPTPAPGTPVPIAMEYYQGMGGAEARLLWSAPGHAKALIPTSALRADDGRTPGLTGTYFRDRQLERKGFVRVDPQVSFDWGRAGPFDAAPRAPGAPMTLSLQLPAGRYRARWSDPSSGRALHTETFAHAEGARALAAPPFEMDVVLLVQRVDQGRRTRDHILRR